MNVRGDHSCALHIQSLFLVKFFFFVIFLIKNDLQCYVADHKEQNDHEKADNLFIERSIKYLVFVH